MLEEITVAIAQRLNALFGDSYAIYSEDIPQDLRTPCFHIRSLGITTRQFLGTRKQRGQPFDILYFPASDSAPRAEIRGIQAILLDGMNLIILEDGMLRGTAMRCETVDNVGHFLADYNIIVRKPTPDPEMMEQLEFIPQTKGSDMDGG